MKYKHTPGPWAAVGGEGEQDRIVSLADIPERERAVVSSSEWTHLSDDDARLIALAPEMLEFVLGKAEEGDAEAARLLLKLEEGQAHMINQVPKAEAKLRQAISGAGGDATIGIIAPEPVSMAFKAYVEAIRVNDLEVSALQTHVDDEVKRLVAEAKE